MNSVNSAYSAFSPSSATNYPMTPERWEQIGELYEAVKELPLPERGAWLDLRCVGDEELRREVESMLAADESIGDFIAAPALKDAAAQLAGESEGSMVGRQLGHYELLSLIGAGGMGEVYAARDSRLGRRVAVKLLPEGVARDPDRLRRFEQEARAVSMLNHPNIITIHDVGADQGTPYLVTELLEGETLRQRIHQNQDGEPRKITLNKAIDYALQMTHGLAAAHARGLVHRDLKPENLFITREERLKILDFGLARGVQMSQNGSDADAPTTSGTRTQPGLVMGTAGYMSPEQVRGEETDTRADIFAFGVILFEMLAGERPFRGPSGPETMSAILQQETPELPAAVRSESPGLALVVRRCLEKRPEQRFQTASDLGFAIESLTSLGMRAVVSDGHEPPTAPLPVLVSGPAASTNRGRSMKWGLKWGGWIVAAAVVLAGGGMFAARFRTPPVSTRVIPFTSFPGQKSSPVFSPDGNQIAFIWDAGGAEGWGVYVQLIDAGAPLRLAATWGNQNSNLAWSPDGRYIAFVRGGPGGGGSRGDSRGGSEREARPQSGIFIVPALGGPERKLTELTGSFDWAPDGKTLAIAAGESSQGPISISLLSLDTGEQRRLTAPPEGSFGDISPSFSPDGRKLAFIRNPNFLVSDVYVIPTAGGEAVRLTSDNLSLFGSLAWTANGGEIVFSSPRGGLSSLWKVSSSGPGGRGLRRTIGIGEYAYSPSVSRQGDRLAYVYRKMDINIWRTPGPLATAREGAAVPLIASTREDQSAQYSPDGRRIAFISDRSGSRELWVCAADGRHPIQLTSFGGSHTGTPRWSPDGRWIAFDSRPEGQSEIYVISAEGGRPRRVTTDDAEDVLPSWSRDGRWIYFGSRRNGDWQIWKIPAEGGTAVQVTQQGGYEAFESADGQFIYFVRREPGIWRMPVGGGEASLILDRGIYARWALLEQGICLINPRATPQPAIEFYDFATRQTTTLQRLNQTPFSGATGLSVSADGERLLYWLADRIDNDIMLVENFH